MHSNIRIDSLTDPRVAEFRLIGDPAALRRAGHFVAEGRLVVRRLLTSVRFRTRAVLVTPAAERALADVLGPRAPRDAPLHLRPSPVPVYLVEQSVMNGLTGFNMHRGCLALAERPAIGVLEGASELVSSARRVVVLERVNNPDNVGGIFRSAAAFGVDLVVMGPDCSDPLYRKAIRTSMAATLQVPFVDAGPWPEALSRLRAAGLRVLALTPASDATALESLPSSLARAALLVGTEGEGLSRAALAHADQRVRISMEGSVDSLNVAVAASIALYHFSRRRGSNGAPY